MTILFLNRRFYPLIGGVEKHVLEISKRLLKKHHRVIVITEKDNSSKSLNINSHTEYSEFAGIEIIRIKAGNDNWQKKFRIWYELFRIRKFIKEADVVHCHDVFFWYLPFRLLYPLKHVYTTFHGYESYPITIKAVIIRKITELLSRGNICIGDFITKWYGTKPDFISYGAVKLTHEIKKVKNVVNNSAVFIGRLDDQTGILEYVKSVDLIRKKYHDFDFLAVGDGDYRKKIEKSVKVTGFEENPERYFQNFRFAFVSRYLSILEAMAAKRLVFSLYDNPIKKDYLELAPFSKFIIIESSPQALAEKVMYYIKNPSQEKDKIDLAFNWVKEQTWDKLSGIYLKLWNKRI